MAHKGECPLHLSVRNEKWSEVLRLIDLGADINCRICSDDCTAVDTVANTVLHIAVTTKDVPKEVVSKLISPRNINMLDSAGESALHAAIRVERWDLVLLLVERGAHVDCATLPSSMIPLHIALLEKWSNVPVEIITSLISSSNINKQLYRRLSPLHLVLNSQRWDLVPVLIQHGADVNAVNVDNVTPLHAALHTGVPSGIVMYNVGVSYRYQHM